MRLPNRTTCVAIVVLGLSACDAPAGANPFSAPRTECGLSANVAVVAGTRSNSPAPAARPEVRHLIFEAVVGRRAVTVVGVEGAGAIPIVKPVELPAEARNTARLNNDRLLYVEQVVKQIAEIRPTSPETDLLRAIGYASDQIRSGGPGTVVVLDSGLQTVAPLDFRVHLGSEPADVAESLAADDALPDLTGITVVFYGLGDVARPQPPLDRPRQHRVRDMWRTIVEKAGGCAAAFEEHVPDTAAAPDRPPVSVVSMPREEEWRCGDNRVLNGGSVGFLPDTATLRDRESAQQTLSRAADLLKRVGVTAELIGTTADDGPGDGMELSRLRAGAIRDELVALGVDPLRLAIDGVGESRPAGRGLPAYVADRDAAGRLIPEKAAENRFVLVRIHCGG